MKTFFSRTFSSLKIRNYRLYYFAQIVSVSGTFLQALAQDWLVLKLTNSGLMLGLVSAFQFLPLLIITPWGGVIADRFPKLRLLYITQSISGALALILGILVLTNTIQIWMVFIFALCLGLTNSLDNPTRQTFVFEMVGKEHIKNAVSLWTILISSARVIGPAIAGILIATVGIGQCFIINAISYVAVLIALLLIRREELQTVPPVPHAKGQIREGFRYVLKTPILLSTLIMMTIIGTITFEWQASMPLFARFVLNGDAGTYAAITVALGIGMLVGGLITAHSANTTQKRLVGSAFFFGVTTLIASVMTHFTLSLVAFFFVGVFSMMFANVDTSILQINTDPQMRGRVMALWAMAFFGSTAVGGPLIGWIGQSFGAEWSLATGGFAAIIASVYGYVHLRRIKREASLKPHGI